MRGAVALQADPDAAPFSCAVARACNFCATGPPPPRPGGPCGPDWTTDCASGCAPAWLVGDGVCDTATEPPDPLGSAASGPAHEATGWALDCTATRRDGGDCRPEAAAPRLGTARSGAGVRAAPPPPVGLLSATLVLTSGIPVFADLSSGEEAWFRFSAESRTTYGIETSLGTLSDTVLELVGIDGVATVDQNDDDQRIAGVVKSSYLEWTCDNGGEYYVLVKGFGSLHGTFELTIAELGSIQVQPSTLGTAKENRPRLRTGVLRMHAAKDLGLAMLAVCIIITVQVARAMPQADGRTVPGRLRGGVLLGNILHARPWALQPRRVPATRPPVAADGAARCWPRGGARLR
jgi:hypothetical protein